MTRLAATLTLASVVSALVACDTTAMNASFCKSYQESFVKQCTETCAKAGRTACDCKAALVKDKQFASRCPALAATAAAASSSPAPH